MKSSPKKIIFEFMSIVVAVVLAMGLTEWRQNILNHRQAEESFQNILNEIQSNRNRLVRDSVDIASSVEVMNRWLDADESSRDTIDVSIGFNLKLLTSSAWEVAKFNGSLSFLDSEKVLNVSGVYEIQDFYEKVGAELFETMADVVKIGDDEDPIFEQELTAYGIKMQLVYGALTTFLGASDEVLDTYPNSSAEED